MGCSKQYVRVMWYGYQTPVAIPFLLVVAVGRPRIPATRIDFFMQKGGENQKFTGTRAGTILDSMKEEVGSASTGIWDWINAKKGEVTEPYPHRHRHAESTSDGVAEPSEGGEGGHASSASGQLPSEVARD